MFLKQAFTPDDFLFSGCSDQTERLDKQISNDQQPGEQDQLPKEERYNHLGGGDWVVPCFHAVVYVWLKPFPPPGAQTL